MDGLAVDVNLQYTNRLAVHQTVSSHRCAQGKNWKYTILTNAEAAMSHTQNYKDVGLLLHVFTDGSYDPVSKTGGWAFAVFRGSIQVVATFGGEARTANNAMELLAILKACEWLADNAAGEEAVIHTDSAYAVNGCTRWRHIWRSNKWRKRMPNGQGRSRSVPDAAYWQAIDTLLNQNPTIKIEWCKGHVGVEGNEVADRLAERGRLIGG
ncbi:ribonuclease H [Rhizobium sp. RCC_161_2]|uniref:ribonuclease H family protein n=1 Tax=Rhizobium sp. RCC_161_2 TaxID=3239219 RepID=UPI0035249856